MNDYTPEADVRAYAITRGRSNPAVQLDFETILTPTDAGAAAVAEQRFERLSIVRELQREPMSVAELSVHLSLPLGVVRVVAGDMVAEQLLTAHRPLGNVADDVDLIRRLIEGIRAL